MISFRTGWGHKLARILGVVGLAFALARSHGARAETRGTTAQRADQAYLDGDFEQAATLYQNLLDAGALSDPAVREPALEHLGISLTILERRDEARAVFLQLLGLNPAHRLDEMFVLPEVVAYYESIRAEFVRELPEPSIRPTNPLALSLMPFGIGQIYNEQPAKGYALMAAEGLAVGLSVFSYYYKQGFCEDIRGGTCLTDDKDAHNRWQQVQQVSAFVASGLIIYGLVDGALYYREEKPLSLAPTPTPDGRGLGLAMEWRY